MARKILYNLKNKIGQNYPWAIRIYTNNYL